MSDTQQANADVLNLFLKGPITNGELAGASFTENLHWEPVRPDMGMEVYGLEAAAKKKKKATLATKEKTCKPTRNPCCKPTKDTRAACCKKKAAETSSETYNPIHLI